MKYTALAIALFAPLAYGAPTVTASFACQGTGWTLSAPDASGNQVLTCLGSGTPPPTTCPPGQVGTPPNCTTPPPGGPINCGAQFSSTHVLKLDWNSVPPGAVIVGYSSSVGGFAQTGAFIVEFTTPSGTSPNTGSLESGEYQSNPANVISKLSATPCDFAGARNGGSSPTIEFVVGSGSAAQLNPNTTYYWNMMHDSSCTASVCNIVVNLTKPQGE